MHTCGNSEFRIPNSEFSNSYHASLNAVSQQDLPFSESRLFNSEFGIRNSRIEVHLPMPKKQLLSLFDLTMIVIGLVIGLGIFRTAKDTAVASATPSIFFLTWVAGGLVALCGALTYAEIGSRYPITGGYYKIFATCYHPSIAFAINCIILISNAASLAGVALIGSEYISLVLFDHPPSDMVRAGIGIFAVALFYGVNLMGLRMSSRTQNVLMAVKISMLLLIVSAVFFPSQHATQAAAPVDVSGWDWIRSFGVALVAVSFTYGGYQQTINFGEEVVDPSRNIPRGIFRGILIIILLYLAVNYAYYKVVGFDQLKTSDGIASIVAERLLGPPGKYIFSVLLYIAVLAYVNVILLSNPRVMFAMSQDGILPSAFQKKDSKGVLTVSLTVYAVLTVVILFFAKTFDKILSFSIFLDSIGMAFSAGALFILRRKTAHLDKSKIYVMKWYPLMPIIFIAAYTVTAISIAMSKPMLALTASLVLAAFVALYFLTRSIHRKPIGEA
jgi:basic amino acid/polyamine antiporter, APA family